MKYAFEMATDCMKIMPKYTTITSGIQVILRLLFE
jgi:hypothetical protein